MPEYSRELALAAASIHRASIITKEILRSLENQVPAEIKVDASPVTAADFAAQALIISAVHSVYPSDRFVGEEDAEELRNDNALARRVWDIVQTARPIMLEHQDLPLALPETMEDMLKMIDLGMTEYTSQGRVWVLDPIDGTATFMKGQQYAVCLCLLVDGLQHLAVIGCPNLSFQGTSNKIHEDQADPHGYGVLVSAVKGQGTYLQEIRARSLGDPRQIKRRTDGKQLWDLDFIESTIGKTSLSQSEHKAVAERLGATWPTTVIWSQQMKYVSLALGLTDVMVRIPKTRERYIQIWDHAGGCLLYEEAGGMIRDVDGRPILFGQGRKLRGENNFGMVAAMPYYFESVMDAVKAVIRQRPGGDAAWPRHEVKYSLFPPRGRGDLPS